MNDVVELKISKPLIDVIEKGGFGISETTKQDGLFFTELEFWSEKGEDVIISLFHNNTDKSFVESLATWWANFDPEEHAVRWYDAKNVVSGVPQSLRALLYDADKIDDTVRELVFELKNCMKEV